MPMKYKLSNLLKEFKEINIDSLYGPVAVGKYGIRKRSDIYKKELSDDYSKNKVIRRDTLIIGMGSNQIDVGVLTDNEIYSVSPAYHTYLIDTSIINSKYLDFVFKANNSTYFNKYSIATARQGKKIDLNSLLKETIDVPSLVEQKIIVGKIIEINNLINIEENLLVLFDELIRSRFIEMFGDIERNDKGYQLVEFQHYVSDMHIGPFGSDMKNEVFVDKNNGYSIVYEQKHAIQKSMDLPARYITKEKFLKMQHFVVGPGDIIVSCRGTLGESFVIPEDAPIGVIHPSLMLIKLKHGVNPKFILFILENIFKDKDGRGAGVKMAIKASELSKIKVINPPVNVIEKFISLINFIDKLKFLYLPIALDAHLFSVISIY